MSYTRPAKNEEAKQNTTTSTTVVLLTGNSGYRMKSYGPPILQKMPNGELLMDHQVKIIKKCIPYCDIIISCNSNIDKIVKKKPSGVRLIENQLHDSNEVEEVRLCLNNAVTDNVLFICSDMYFDETVFSGININKFNENKSFIIYDTNGSISSDSIGVTITKNRATIMSYGLVNKWARFFFLGKNDIKSFTNFCKEPNNKRLFMHEAINNLLEKKSINAFNPSCTLYRIESISDMEKLPKK